VQILSRLNNLIDKNKYQSLTVNGLSDFLVDEGLLEVIPLDNGHFRRQATVKGNSVGITTANRESIDGAVYTVNVYDKFAQNYIVGNIESVVDFNNGTQKINERVADNIAKSRRIFEAKQRGEYIEEPSTKERKYTCRDCMDSRNGNCFGGGEICEDFRFAYTYSQKEVENWPTEGDATYYRRKRAGKSGD
jgi:hypothetical protein